MDVDASSSQIQVMVGEEELEIPEALTEDVRRTILCYNGLNAAWVNCSCT